MHFIKNFVILIGLLFFPFSTYAQNSQSEEDRILKIIEEKYSGSTRLTKSLKMYFKLDSVCNYSELNIVHIASRIIDLAANEFKIDEEMVWEVTAVNKIEIFKNIYLISIWHSKYPDDHIESFYDRSNDQIYILPLGNYNDMNDLISNADLKLNTDFEILRFCRLVTLLNHPSSFVIFISSINELIMEAVYQPLAFYSLRDSMNFSDIKVGLPSIIRDGELIRVNFYIARDEDLLKVKISIIEKKIMAYSEDKIGDFPYWW